jgi:hypothetical protein
LIGIATAKSFLFIKHTGTALFTEACQSAVKSSHGAITFFGILAPDAKGNEGSP